MTTYHSNALITLTEINGLKWSTGEDDIDTDAARTHSTRLGDVEFIANVKGIGERSAGKFQVVVEVNDPVGRAWDPTVANGKLWKDTAEQNDTVPQHVLKDVYATGEDDGLWRKLGKTFTLDSIGEFNGNLVTKMKTEVNKLLNCNGDGNSKTVATVYGRMDIDTTNDIFWYPTEDTLNASGKGGVDGIFEDPSQMLALEIAKVYSRQTGKGEGGAKTVMSVALDASYVSGDLVRGTDNAIGDSNFVSVHVNVDVKINSEGVPQTCKDLMILFTK
jgi:hypothetical protein